jgi:hypothetical protein
MADDSLSQRQRDREADGSLSIKGTSRKEKKTKKKENKKENKISANALAGINSMPQCISRHQCRGGRKTAEEEERGMEAVCALLGAPALIDCS